MKASSALIALIFACFITVATYLVPPLWSPSPTGEYEEQFGWPLPWGTETKIFDWIPFIGPTLKTITQTFNPLFFIIDVGVFFCVGIVILGIASKKGAEV